MLTLWRLAEQGTDTWLVVRKHVFTFCIGFALYGKRRDCLTWVGDQDSARSEVYTPIVVFVA